MNTNTDRDWLLKKAEQEDGCDVSAGGFVTGPVQGFVLTAGNNELIVTIHFDGRVTVNPKYSTEEAARAFWDEVRRLGRTNPLDPDICRASPDCPDTA